MGRRMIVILIVSLIGNLLGLLVLYKAYDYRKKMMLAWAQSHDWVSEYNKKVPEHAQDLQNPSLVFLGASITAHWDLAKYFPGRPFMNQGIDGHYAGHLLLRFQHDVADLHPYGVVLKLCEMNFAHQIPLEISQNNLRMLATLAKANGIRPIIATTIPVTKKANQGKGEDSINGQIHAFNIWLREYAKQNQFEIIDYGSAMADQDGFLLPELTYDGIHPNDQGYAAMANQVEDFLRKEQR